MSRTLASGAKIFCDGPVHATGDPSQPLPTPRSLSWSWLWLGGSAVAMTLGWFAKVRPDAATWFGVRGPECPLGTCLGPVACPGCGLVRSTASALQGDLPAAFAMHPGGIGIALLLPATFAVHFDILRRGHERAGHRRLRRTGHALTTAAILIGWLLRFTF